MGLATTLAGFIVSQDATGGLTGYRGVGYIAVAANLVAIWYVSRIVMHDSKTVVADVALN
jgi:hypothetical protein